MKEFDVIGLLLPALEKVGDRIIGYDDQIRKKFNRALEKALSSNNELYVQKAKVHMTELVGLIVLVMDEPSSIHTILLPNYISRDEFRRFYAETEKDKDLCQVLKDEWNQYKAKDTYNIVKTIYKHVVEQTGSIDEVKGLVAKLISSIEELYENVGKIVDKGGRKSETSKIDDYNQLYKCLDEKLHAKREKHPSFQLMKIDDRLFPNAQTKQKHIKLEALDSNDKLKTVRDIIEESWGKGKQNHLMIEGDGGIGKTVTLLSIPDTNKFAPHYVPAIYIPLHELTTGEDPIERYIKKKILKNKGDLYEQLLDLVDQPWDNGPRLLLLFDGFNEISAEQRVPIGRDIVYWSEFHGVQIITSSRYDIHTYVALGDKYSAIKLQALSNTTVEEYLGSMNIPISTDDAVKKLITTPLLLTLYAMTERVLEERECDSSNFKEVKSAGSIVWNYLQCELWNFGKEGEDAKNAIIAMEFIAPYIAWRMQQKTLFVLNKKEFHDFLKEAYHLLEKHFDKTEEFPFQISDAIQKSNGIPPLDLIRSLLENKLCLFVKNGNDYRLMHQQFRDALAALHLINLSYLSGDSLPQEWSTPVDYYVMQFVADLITETEANRLWEQNRKTAHAIDDATRNQLRLQGLRRYNDFSELDFSGLDLSNISLYPYRLNDGTIKMPKSERLKNTKLSIKTFSAEGHSGSVNAIAVTPDNKRIVSGSWDKTIRIWDLESSIPIGSPIVGHKKPVKAIAITHDGKYIVSGSYDNTIRVWDMESGAAKGAPLIGHENSVNAVAVTLDGKRIVSGSADRTIRVWDMESGTAIGNPLIGHENSVNAVAVTTDGKRIVSGSSDNTIRIWDLDSGKQIGKPIIGHERSVYAIALTPDGRHIISGSSDKTIRIWDMDSGKQIYNSFEGHEKSVKTIALVQNGKLVVSGSWDKTIRIWDKATGNLIGNPLVGHDDSVLAVAVSPNGRYIVSGSYDGTIRVWDMQTGVSIGNPIEGHKDSPIAIAVTPDDKRIISGSWDKTIRIWDLNTGAIIEKPTLGCNDSELVVAVSPDGERVVSWSLEDNFRVWDLKTRTPIGEPIVGHEDWVRAVAVTPDGKRIVCGSDDKTIRILDLQTGAQIGKTIMGHEDWVRAVTVTPKNGRIVSGSDDRTIRVWDMETGEPIGKPIKGHKDWVRAVAVSKDGKSIISGSWDGTIRIWDIESGNPIGVIEGHKHPVTAIALTSDIEQIVDGEDDGTIRIWKKQTIVEEENPFEGNNLTIADNAAFPAGTPSVYGIGDVNVSIPKEDYQEIRAFRVLPLTVLGLDFSEATILDDELKTLLRQNGAKV